MEYSNVRVGPITKYCILEREIKIFTIIVLKKNNSEIILNSSVEYLFE